MTRDEVNLTLRHMERLREDAMEAETHAEEKRLQGEYDRLWKQVEPFVIKQTKSVI